MGERWLCPPPPQNGPSPPLWRVVVLGGLVQSDANNLRSRIRSLPRKVPPPLWKWIMCCVVLRT